MYHARFKGRHYDMGLNFGKAAAKKGKRLLDNVPYPITSDRVDFGQECLKVCHQVFPELCEEIKGIADGQGEGFEQLCAVIFSMYALPPSPACSCFAYSKDGNVILGRNSDFITALERLNSNCIYIFSGRDRLDFMANTTAFVEMEDGVNSAWLAAGLTSVAPGDIKPGLNGGLLVRFILERCRSTAEAIEAIKGLPIASAQTITLADRSGDIALLECDSGGMTLLRPNEKEHFVRAVNRFYAHPFSPPLGLGDWQSEARYETMTKALSSPGFKGTAEEARSLLKGRYGFICQYDRKTGHDTVWSSVYDLRVGKVYRAEGNPSKKPFGADTRFNL